MPRKPKYREFQCFCKVCSGIVLIRLPYCISNCDYLHERLRPGAGGECDKCGTWFRARDVLREEDITGEAGALRYSNKSMFKGQKF